VLVFGRCLPLGISEVGLGRRWLGHNGDEARFKFGSAWKLKREHSGVVR